MLLPWLESSVTVTPRILWDTVPYSSTTSAVFGSTLSDIVGRYDR